MNKLEIAELEIDHLKHELFDEQQTNEKLKETIADLEFRLEFPPKQFALYSELCRAKDELHELRNLLYVATRYPDELENVRKRMGVDNSLAESENALECMD